MLSPLSPSLVDRMRTHGLFFPHFLPPCLRNIRSVVPLARSSRVSGNVIRCQGISGGHGSCAGSSGCAPSASRPAGRVTERHFSENRLRQTYCRGTPCGCPFPAPTRCHPLKCGLRKATVIPTLARAHEAASAIYAPSAVKPHAEETQHPTRRDTTSQRERHNIPPSLPRRGRD